MTNDLLNFRCPPELLAAVDALGCDRYPNPKASHGCDRSKTLLDIVRAGISALSDGTIILPTVLPSDKSVKQQPSDTLLDERITEIIERKTEALSTEIKQLREELGEFAA